MEIKQLIEDIQAKHTAIEQRLQATGDEAKSAKAEVSKLIDDIKTTDARVTEALQRLHDAAKAGKEAPQTFGAAVMAAGSIKSFLAGETSRGQVSVKSPLFSQTPAGASDSTVVAPSRVGGIVTGPMRMLSILDLVPSIPVTTNLVEFTQEGASTNSAAFTADRDADGPIAAPVSSFSFDPASVQVRTIKHLTKVHKNMLADAPQIAGYLDTRMNYFTRKNAEAQIIAGNGNGQNLSGMFKAGNHVAFTPTAGETAVDSISRGLEAADLAGYQASVVIVSTSLWYSLSRLKTADDKYLLGDPTGVVSFSLWGRTVVSSPAVPAGKFLVCDLQAAYTFFNRADVQVSMYTQNEDDVSKGLVTILAEARGALATWAPAAAVAGDAVAA